MSVVQDLRYGLRLLVRAPGFTTAAVAALALGIGANAVIFTVVNALLLRPLPVPEPDRLVVPIRQASDGMSNSFSYADLRDYRERSDVFAGLAARQIVPMALGHRGDNDLVWGEMVSGDYFSVLGVKPQLGRGFLPEEDRTEGSHPVAVLGHHLWEKRFGADPRIVGGTIDVNGRAFTVVGVAPADFTGTEFALGMDLWVPLAMHEAISPGSAGLLEERGWRTWKAIGRLRDGIGVQQASAALQAVSGRLAEEFPDTNRGLRASVVSERRGRFPPGVAQGVTLGAWTALVVAALVLLIACANVANLLLARAAARQREIGVRLALGAGRGRLVRQLLTEGLLLAALGGAAGLVLTTWTADLLLGFHPPIPFRVALDYAPDWRVVSFTAAAALATVVLFGLVPALSASRTDLVRLLRGGTATPGGRRRHRPALADVLVAGQLAVSLIVLACAGLFLRSLGNAASIDPGFSTRGVVMGSFDLGLLDYSDDRGRRFASDLVRRMEAVGGVDSAAILDDLPLDTEWSRTGPVIADGQPDPADGRGLRVEIGRVSPGLFRTLGVPLLRGRDFEARDDAGAPAVAVINETLAARLFPGEEALGRRLRLHGGGSPAEEIIGVVRDAKYGTLGEQPAPFVYRPLSQEYNSRMTLLARGPGDPSALLDAVRREAQALDSRLPLYGVRTIEEHMGYALWWTRMGAMMASLFGLLGLLLAAVGLAGLVAYMVRRMRREIGVRMALGARPADVQRLMVRRGLFRTLFGLGAGLLGAAGLGPAMAPLLYGIRPVEPLVLLAVAALLGGIALLATWLPARRAALIDPMEVLRLE